MFRCPRRLAPVSTVAADGVEQIRDVLAQARRPLIVVSGNAWSPGGRDALRGLAEKSDLPVATATRRQDIVDNRSEVFVGTLGLQTTPGLPGFAAEADVVLLLGARPDGLTVEDGDWLTTSPAGRRLLHVYPDPDVLGSVYPADVAMAARPDDVAEALAAALVASPLPTSEERTEWCRRLREHRVALRTAQVDRPHPAAFMAALAEQVAPDAVLDCGGGRLHRLASAHHDYIVYPSQVASHSGSMGYGLPAAIAAAFALPSREVVAFAGDGCFLMSGQELSHGGSLRLGDHRGCGLQRRVRHDSASSGAQVSRTAERNRLGEPGFRRAGACSRRLGRDRAYTRRVRRGAGCPARRRGVPGGGGPGGSVVDAAARCCLRRVDIVDASS